MSTSGDLELLHMVSELGNEDVGTLKKVDCEIPRWLEKETNIPYKGVKTSPNSRIL